MTSNRETNLEYVRRTMGQELKRRLNFDAKKKLDFLSRVKFLNESEYEESLDDFYFSRSGYYLASDSEGYTARMVYEALYMFEDRKSAFLIHSLLYTLEIQ